MIKRTQILELDDCPEGREPAPCKFIIPGYAGAFMSVVTDRGVIDFSEAETDAIFMLLRSVRNG